MNCECGDSDCDCGPLDFPDYETLPDIDPPIRSSSRPLPQIQETIIQKIGTVCMVVLVGGSFLISILILLAIPVAVLIVIALLAWKIIQFTHYLIAIPILIVGTCAVRILKFVMSEPNPIPQKR